MNRLPLQITPEALLMALACAEAARAISRPNLDSILLDASGHVVATNGHILSATREGWFHTPTSYVGNIRHPAEREGAWLLSGDLKGLARVAKAANTGRNPGAVILFPVGEAGDSWRAEASTAKKAPAPVLVTVRRNGDGWKYPEWRQVLPHGDKVSPCLVAVDLDYLGVFAKAIRSASASAAVSDQATARLYTTAAERAIILRATVLPDWVGLLMPVRGRDIPGWDLDTSAEFLGTHGKAAEKAA